jgi:hypothetical protein
MAALHVAAAPGLVVSTSATASAGGFLLPLILGLSTVGFIFSAVIALSPTAAEIVEEDELMKRIGQSQAARYEPKAWQATTSPVPRVTDQTGPLYQLGQTQPGADGEGSLFRPHRAQDQS